MFIDLTKTELFYNYLCLHSTAPRILVFGYECFMSFAISLMVDPVVVMSSMITIVSFPFNAMCLARENAFLRLCNLPFLSKLACVFVRLFLVAIVTMGICM